MVRVGSWVTPSLTAAVSSLALGVGATVVFVDYHRAPQHHYPVAIEDAYAATLYVSVRNERFKVDSKHLAVRAKALAKISPLRRNFYE